MEKYACLDFGQEEVMAELNLLKAGGLLQLGREAGHLGVQHISHQIILKAVYQKGHVSSSLILCSGATSLREQIQIHLHVEKYKYDLVAGSASKHCL